VFISGVMVCVPRWCSGLCFSVVEWFVFLSVLMVCVPRLCTGFCSSVVREAQTIILPRNTNHYSTEHKPLHQRRTQTSKPQRSTKHYTTEEQKPVHNRGTQTIKTLRNTNHSTTEKHKPLHHRGTQTITPLINTYWFLFLGGVMFCASLWFTGLCSSLV
jgi:hypothetical protein